MPTYIQANGQVSKSTTSAYGTGVAIVLANMGSLYAIGDIIVVTTLTNFVDTNTVTDSAGNTYTKVSTQSVFTSFNFDIFYTVATAYTAPNFINWIANSNEAVGKTYNVGVYVIRPDSGTTFSSTGALFSSATGSGTTPSITTASLSANQVLIGTVCINGPNGDTWTEDNDTLNGTWSSGQGATGPSISAGTTGAGAASNYSIRSQYKLITSSGAQTFNPTLGSSRSYGVNYVAITQTGTPTYTPNNPMGMMGFFGT